MLKILPLGLAVAFSLLGDLSLFAILVTELDTLHITLAQAGILLSIHRLVRIPINPLVGLIQDFTGRKPIFLTGMLLAVLSTAAYGLVSGFFMLLLSRIAWGVAWACIHVSGTTLTLDMAKSANRARMAGAYNAWLWVGYAMAPLAGSFLAQHNGFQPAMRTCAFITAAALLLALWQVPETLPKTLRLPLSKWKSSFSRLKALFTFGNIPSLLKKTQFTYLLTQFAGDGVILSTTTLLLTQRLGDELTIGAISFGIAAVSSMVMAARSIFAGLSSPAFGWLCDRFPRRETTIIMGLAMTASGFILMSISENLVITIAGIVLSAFGNAACWVSLPALLADQTSLEERGGQMGRFALAGDVGSTAGPFFALALAPHLGLNSIFAFCCVVFLTCILLWAPSRHQKGI